MNVTTDRFYIEITFGSVFPQRIDNITIEIILVFSSSVLVF